METPKHPDILPDTQSPLKEENTPKQSIEASQGNQVSEEGAQCERIPPSLRPEQTVAIDALSQFNVQNTPPQSIEATIDHQVLGDDSQYERESMPPEQPITNKCCIQLQQQLEQAEAENKVLRKELAKKNQSLEDLHRREADRLTNQILVEELDKASDHICKLEKEKLHHEEEMTALQSQYQQTSTVLRDQVQRMSAFAFAQTEKVDQLKNCLHQMIRQQKVADESSFRLLTEKVKDHDLQLRNLKENLKGQGNKQTRKCHHGKAIRKKCAKKEASASVLQKAESSDSSLGGEFSVDEKALQPRRDEIQLPPQNKELTTTSSDDSAESTSDSDKLAMAAGGASASDNSLELSLSTNNNAHDQMPHLVSNVQTTSSGDSGTENPQGIEEPPHNIAASGSDSGVEDLPDTEFCLFSVSLWHA